MTSKKTGWSRKNSPRKEASPKAYMPTLRCTDCRKRVWPSRRMAKQYARQWHPDTSLRAYQCPQRPDWWHYGNTQQRAKRGEI